MNKIIAYKPLGEILQDAGLVTDSQIKVALYDKKYYQDLRVGEILAMRGWIEQKTADFFGEQWFGLIDRKQEHPIGYYLKQAGLLTERDIQLILHEQKTRGLRFGTMAVTNGMLRQQTIDFFLKNLFSYQAAESNYGRETSQPEGESKDNQITITKKDIAYWAKLSTLHLT